MRALAVIVLSIIVIIAAGYFLILSTCAISAQGLGGSLSVGERIASGLAALAALAGIIGLVRVILKLNRDA